MAKTKKKVTVQKTSPTSQEPVLSGPAWLTNTKLHLWVIFVFSASLYLNTLRHDYALDDAIVIYDNMFTVEGIKGIPGILGNDTFYGFFKEEGKAALVAGGRYRPLSLLTFALEVQLFGAKPWIGHLMNALLYGFTVLLLYLLTLKVFRLRYSPLPSAFIALVASLLFAAHPLHVEVVANIKGRDEILSLMGSLAALYYSLRAYLEKKPKLQLWAGLFFFLGLMSKENAITFLAIVPLTYYIFTRAKTAGILRQMIPFAAAAVLFLIIRFSILGFSLGHTPMELMNNPFLKIEDSRWVPFTFGEKMATVMFTLGKYLQLLIFPHPLTHDYYPKHIYLPGWGNWKVLLSLLAYLGLLVFAIRGLLKKDPLSFGILFYLITLSIVSNIVFPVGTNMSERLIFMPSVGFAIAIAVLAWRLVGNDGKKMLRLNPVLLILAIVTLLFAGKTVARNAVWENNFTLFTTDVRTAPNSAKLRNAAGGELITQATQETNEAEKRKMLSEAVEHLKEAIRLHPTYKNAYLLLGNAYNYLGQYEASVDAYQKALRLDPDYVEASNNLGITYRDAGKYYGEKQNDLEKSIAYLQKAYELRPKEYETVRLLGVAFGIRGNTGAAIRYFNEATQLNPKNADAWFNLGVAYQRSGQANEGAAYIRRAEELEPGITERRQRGG